MPNADPEEDSCDQDGGNSAPGEAEGVDAKLRSAADRGELLAHLDEGGRHERRGNREEEERDRGHHAREGGTQASEAGQEAGEEGDDGEQEREKVEDPAEPPQVEVRVARRAASVGADEALRQVRARGVLPPGPADGRVWPSVAAAPVTLAANPEEGPLRDRAGAADGRGVGAQEVGLSERRRPRRAGEDDEE